MEHLQPYCISYSANIQTSLNFAIFSSIPFAVLPTALVTKNLFVSPYAWVPLRWLVSTSVFLVQTTAYSSGPKGHRIHTSDTSLVGYSPIGIHVTSYGCLVMLATLVRNSLRTYDEAPKSFVRMDTRSSGIIALCRASREDCEAYLFPVCPVTIG